ncbi:hypothetical protein FRC09_019614, partial [Ceratobasidium sp. 395]
RQIRLAQAWCYLARRKRRRSLPTHAERRHTQRPPVQRGVLPPAREERARLPCV